jgi:hypothetical protein
LDSKRRGQFRLFAFFIAGEGMGFRLSTSFSLGYKVKSIKVSNLAFFHAWRACGGLVKMA